MAAITASTLAALPTLSSEYKPCTFDYVASRDDGLPVLKDWIQVFRASVPTFERFALRDTAVADREKKASQFEQRFLSILQTLEENPTADLDGFGSAPTDCLRLCKLRDECLRQAGFHDIYKEVKAQENDRALSLLKSVLDELDGIEDDSKRMESAIRGVFAGNIFDMGASASAALYVEGAAPGEMFRKAKSELVPRPWAVDCLDAVMQRLDAANAPHRKALVFVDNAGSDVVLGMLPFVRELLKRGTQVVIAANEVPSINDITASEMIDVAQRAAAVDSVLARHLAEGSWRTISSGSDLPVIDLRQVSTECIEEARSADLLVLEGMGRGIETNLFATFTCESLKLAMIKHPEVATCLKGRLYDCVCQYHAGSSTSPA